MAKNTKQRGKDIPKRFRKRHIVLLLLVALVAGGVWYGYREFQRSTAAVIQNPAGSSRPMEIPSSQTRRFDEQFFSFELPADWKLIQRSTAPYNLYSYQSGAKNADNRFLDIYVDRLPQAMAVNMALAVKPQGNNLSHGQISENCTTFMPKQAAGAKQLAVPANWDGVEFLCDNDSVTRNVVGTSSPGNVNKVTLTGPTTGQHSFFFVYFDKNYTPDYSILYSMLDSFTVK